MKLSKREKYAVSVAVLFLVIFVLIRFGVSPFMEKGERLERAVQTKTRELDEMIALKAEYDEMRQKAESSKVRIADRPSGFTLFSFLEKLAGEVNIKESIKHMKPSKTDLKGAPFKLSQVEMKLQNINLKELTPYLHKMETSKNSVFIKRISIVKKGRGEGFIDVVLQVETFEM